MSHPVGEMLLWDECAELTSFAVEDDLATAHLGDELQEFGIGKTFRPCQPPGSPPGPLSAPGLLLSPPHAPPA